MSAYGSAYACERDLATGPWSGEIAESCNLMPRCDYILIAVRIERLYPESVRSEILPEPPSHHTFHSSTHSGKCEQTAYSEHIQHLPVSVKIMQIPLHHIVVRILLFWIYVIFIPLYFDTFSPCCSRCIFNRNSCEFRENAKFKHLNIVKRVKRNSRRQCRFIYEVEDTCKCLYLCQAAHLNTSWVL